MCITSLQGRVLSFVSGLLAACTSVVCLVWPGVWGSLVLFFMAIKGNSGTQGLKNGASFGLGVAVPSLFWMIRGIGTFTGRGNIVYGILAFAASSAVLMLFFALLAAALALVGRQVGPILLQVLEAAAVWTLAETIFSALLAGMPWFSFHVGSGLLRNLYAIQPAALGGIALLTFVPVAVNYLAAAIIHQKKNKLLWIPAAIVAAYFGLGALLLAGWQARPQSGKVVSVAILSENIPPTNKWDEQNGTRLVGRLLGLARQAAALHPDIALWAESSVPWTYRPDDDFVRALLQATGGTGITHVLGINTDFSGQVVYNSAYVLLPNGRVAGHYNKQVLLSFAEAPVAGLVLPFITSHGYTVAAGHSAAPLYTPYGKAGIMICNEAAVPRAGTGMASRGAEFILNLSNDGWFSQTYLADLHFYSARLRAVEVRKDVVVNSNMGTSGLIAASGRVALARRSSEPFVAMAAVHPNQYTSLPTRWPWMTEALCGLLLLASRGYALIARKQS